MLSVARTEMVPAFFMNTYENFSKTLLLTNLSKFIFLQKPTPFPNTHYKLKY